MDIKVIGSGSTGNCYRISDGTTALLLEAGLPLKKIKQGCDFDLPAACLITHEHGDHSKSVRDLISAGVDVFCSFGTADKLNILAERGVFTLNENRLCEYGSYEIFGFKVHHDAAEPFGYIIESVKTGERLLFMTDSYYTEYRFPHLTHIMIEANYSVENITDDPRRTRLRKSHMSIEHCLEFLKANDLSRCREIWLIHLSQSNGDAEEFKRRVQEATGCPTYIA